jgi:hypothetical protein
MSIVEKLSGILSQKAEANAASVDAVRDAEALFAKIDQQYNEAQAKVHEINRKLDEAALQSVGNTSNEAAGLLYLLQGESDQLDLLARAKKRAAEKLVEAQTAQRRLAFANQRKVIAKFAKQRSECAAGLVKTIAAYNDYWSLLHEVNAKLQTAYPGGKLPAGSLSAEGTITRAVERELYRIGGNPFVGGRGIGNKGRLRNVPPLPGAPQNLSLGNQETMQTLEAVVNEANAHLLAVMDGAPNLP